MQEIKIKPEHEDLLTAESEFFLRYKKLFDDEFTRLKSQLRNEGFYEAWLDDWRADAILNAFIYDNIERLDFVTFMEHYGYDLVYGDPDEKETQQSAHKEISDRVCEIISNMCAEWFCGDAPEVKPDTTFTSIELDSLDQVELLTEIEDQLGVVIDDDAAEGFKTPGAIIDYIVERQ